MKKKILALFTFILVVALCLTFAACGDNSGGEAGDGGNNGSGFLGKLSEQTYNTADEAAAAFIENEINGSTTQAVFVSYEKISDVKKANVGKLLGVTEEESRQIDGAEQGVIKYTEGEATAYSAQPSGENEHMVYIVRYTSGGYKYFAPEVRTGEMLTKSYYEWVMDSDNYKNCTITMNYSVDASMYMSGITVNIMTMDMEVVYKITETGVHMVENITIRTPDFSSATPKYDEQVVVTEGYIVEVDGALKVVAREDGGEWHASTMSELGMEFNSMDEIFESSQTAGQDWTLFIKTDEGFELRQNKFEAFMDMFLAENAEIGALISQYGEGKYSGKASYTVTEGKLTSSNVELGVNMTVSQQGQSALVKISCSGNNKYAEFGATAVQIPAEVQAILA